MANVPIRSSEILPGNHLVYSTWVKVIGSLGKDSCNTVMEVEPHFGEWRNKRFKKWDIMRIKLLDLKMGRNQDHQEIIWSRWKKLWVVSALERGEPQTTFKSTLPQQFIKLYWLAFLIPTPSGSFLCCYFWWRGMWLRYSICEEIAATSIGRNSTKGWALGNEYDARIALLEEIPTPL